MTKNLLFSSVGDSSNFYNYWCDDNKNYDIYICYYGNSLDSSYKKYSNYYYERKGSKFQNFHYFWLTDPNIKNYEKYYIVDDDIIISTNEINELFQILSQYNLWILQPAFSNNSKISHEITRQQTNNYLRFVNFIENGVMMFNKYAIEKSMEIYNPILVGWGIDWLFLWYLGHENQDKFAIIDSIPCINPYSEIREIDILQSSTIRRNNWKTISNQLNINEWEKIVYRSI